jgi:hypothetical protein
VKELSVNTASASCKELIGIAEKCGFDTFEGNKHTKVKTKDGKFVTMIPRHENINKHTAKGIVDDMNAHGATIIIR